MSMLKSTDLLAVLFITFLAGVSANRKPMKLADMLIMPEIDVKI